MARKLKIMEKEKLPRDDLKNDEITEAWNIKKNNFQNFCGVKRTRHTRTARKQKKSKMAYYKEKIGGAALIPTK